MNIPSFREEKFPLTPRGKDFYFVIRTPENLTRRPVLLITIVADCNSALNIPD